MATTERIDRDELKGFFDRLSKEREGQPVTIEVIDKSIGDQEEVHRLPLAAATFDPKDDVVVLALGGNSPDDPVVHRRMVWHPKEVELAQLDGGQTALRVVDTDGSATLVRFHPADAQS